MPLDIELGWAGAVLSAALRFAPVFAFAPPFTLLRVPARVRVLLVLVLAACAAGAAAPVNPSSPTFVMQAAMDLLAGVGAALALQLAFAALAFVGRLIDIQSGHGLALLIDPATRSQTPLFGTLFGLGAGIAFFDIDGHHALLRALAAPAIEAPALAMLREGNLEPLMAYSAATFSAAFAVGAAALVVLFVVDVAIAFISRSLPQMNVLMLGLQAKALAVLIVAAMTFGLMAPVLSRLVRGALSFAGA